MESAKNPHPPLSMLIVEDDKPTLDALTQIIALKFPSVTISVAENGKAGLQLFKEHTPDIVVTDINMPEMDGIQMSEEMKAIKSDTKVIVLTGYSNKSYLKKFIELGCCAYLMKPIDFGKLCDSIKNCIG